MPSFYKDNHIELYNKDCRQMTELADNSVQCVVTSPPYWGLRKYSGEQELIWGNDHCNHKWAAEIIRRDRGKAVNSDVVGQPREMIGTTTPQGKPCSLCGAWKGAYGLEPTPEMYVQHTIEILREIRRVLRKDGVVFFNIGDSYSGNREKATESATATCGNTIKDVCAKFNKVSGCLKPKDLCLIPFRIAIAAQEDGWWVRSVIIWSKPNPMPESVTDRPTESHEYILMLTKSARYYWDQDAVREPLLMNRWSMSNPIGSSGKNVKTKEAPPGQSPQSFQREGHSGYYRGDGSPAFNPDGRNLRSVWTFPTMPYPEAHFAVFPEKLPELCIKAATPEVGCCSKCGAPRERISAPNTGGTIGHSWNPPKHQIKNGKAYHLRMKEYLTYQRGETIGWQPTCKCDDDKVPSLVLDPFAGAGTTLWVAKKLNRRAVGYEISQEYCQLALERNRQQVLL